MVIEDEVRGIEYHLNLTKDNKIKSIEVIFPEPKSLSCIFRIEGLFTSCGQRARFNKPVTEAVIPRKG